MNSKLEHNAQGRSFLWLCAEYWTSTRLSSHDHPPIAQIPALLDHVQNVGLAAGAGQTGEKEHRGPGGRVGMSQAVIVIKPIQRDLSSIRCLNKLTAETIGTRNSLSCICVSMYPFICHIQMHAYTQTHTNRKMLIQKSTKTNTRF